MQFVCRGWMSLWAGLMRWSYDLGALNKSSGMDVFIHILFVESHIQWTLSEAALHTTV